MKINKLVIKNNVFDINLNFYNFLKKITQAGFTDNQIGNLLTIYFSNKSSDPENIKEMFYNYIEDEVKREDLSKIFSVINDIDSDNLQMFIFSLKLNIVKDLLLEEAKLKKTIISEELSGLHQLSLEYDRISTQVAYATRISGALLSLLFFEKLENKDTNFISEDSVNFINGLIDDYKVLSSKGLEPNQIFMLLFSESINQSITSSAGASYEDRIKNILISLGIPSGEISKKHDVKDSSTEFDFYFKKDGRSYGISAKRTLRERYKQFIKTNQMSDIDIMIEFTLGTDLRENIANSIRNHGVYLFVADEIYNSKKYLRDINGVFPASSLSLDLIKKLN